MGGKNSVRSQPLQTLQKALRQFDKAQELDEALQEPLEIQKALKRTPIKKARDKASQTLKNARNGAMDRALQTLEKAFEALIKARKDLGGTLEALQSDKASLEKESLDEALQAWERLSDKWDNTPQVKELLNATRDETLNGLIARVERLLAEPEKKSELKNAYQDGDYRKAVSILYASYDNWKEGKIDMDAVSDAAVTASGNPPLFLILAVLALAIFVLSFVCLKKLDKASAPNMKVKEIIKGPDAPKAVTEQEKDFLELIRLLAAASDKTDEYLKS